MPASGDSADRPASRTDPIAWGLGAAALLCWLVGLRLLALKWLGVDPAVFEADTYAQGIRHAWTSGSFWPWDLSGRFWPFMFLAPGIYLHLPVLGPLPGGLAALVVQAVAVGACAVALAGLAGARGLSPRLAAGLALTWLLHPLAAVAFSWGWSPYVTGAPLLAAGAWALTAGRRRSGLLLFALAATMKANVALMVAGFGLWLWLDRRSGNASSRNRQEGRILALAAAAWTGLTGAAFAATAWCAGTLSQDVHAQGPASPTAGGLATVGLLLLPALPLLGRRGLCLVALATGIELAYTALVNPANSGLVPATAVLLVAAAIELPRLPRPGLRLLLAASLALFGQQLFAPPRVSPLPLTPAGLAYQPDPRGAVLRDWVEQLPDDAVLLTFDPANGAIGRHPGRVIEPPDWDGRSRVAVLLPDGILPETRACTVTLTQADSAMPSVRAGWCGTGAPPTTPPVGPALECIDGLGMDQP